MRKTTIWLNEKDRQAIKVIRKQYGVATNSAAIRLALRLLAFQELGINASNKSA